MNYKLVCEIALGIVLGRGCLWILEHGAWSVGQFFMRREERLEAEKIKAI